MVDVYSTEPERQAALEELTKLRRELKTETSAGAKAAAKDPRFIAAKKRLDTAKSAAGMRTSAEDLALLNKIDGPGAKGNKTDQQITDRLNTRSMNYFEGPVREAYSNPEKVPNWQANSAFGRTGKGLTKEDIEYAKIYDIDLSKARYDWSWYEPKDEKGNPIPDKPGRWGVSIIGAKKIPKPKEAYIDSGGIFREMEYYTDLFASDSISLEEWAKVGGQKYAESAGPALVQFTKGTPDKRQEMLLNQTRAEFYKAFNPFQGMINPERVNELVEVMPKLTYSQVQEILYRLSLERDTDITVEDISDKYNQLYAKGK